MHNHDYDESDEDEWISAETTSIPPHPSVGHQPTTANRRANQREEPDTRLFVILVELLADVWDALIRIRNLIVYILIFIVSILFWPIGLLLIICLLCWAFRRWAES